MDLVSDEKRLPFLWRDIFHDLILRKATHSGSDLQLLATPFNLTLHLAYEKSLRLLGAPCLTSLAFKCEAGLKIKLAWSKGGKASEHHVSPITS